MNYNGYKYYQVYLHFQKLIIDKTLKKDDRMPSLISCAKELSVSKTTVENAYFQLAADGYIISRERSGYYVTAKHNDSERTDFAFQNTLLKEDDSHMKVYDMANVGDDPSVFRFDLWQRYMKSAIRHKDRMATYGDSQGEIDLRLEIANYVRKRRNIYCTPESIVIGASTQNLLGIFIGLLKENGKRTASVPAKGFERYVQVFKNYNFEVNIRDKESEVIYVSPSHMTRWGDVMSLSRRYEILEHSKKGHIIIEDDYQNELNFSKQVRPSIYALAAGENVVYLGSFSRLLLPSIRISFMILPKELIEAYRRIAQLYDQTASKTEQLALASYLRDEHLHRQIKKIRKLYAVKRELLRTVLIKLVKDIPGLNVVSGDCGTEMIITGSKLGVSNLLAKLKTLGITARKMNYYTDWGEDSVMFSCGFISTEDLIELDSRL